MIRGSFFLNKRGKGAEGVESLGGLCLWSYDVIFDSSHVKGKMGGGGGRKLGFLGGNVSGVHGVSSILPRRYGKEESELSSYPHFLQKGGWSHPKLLFCILQEFCPGGVPPNRLGDQTLKLIAPRSVGQIERGVEVVVGSPPEDGGDPWYIV